MIALSSISIFPSLAGCGLFFVQVAPPAGTPPPLGNALVAPENLSASDDLTGGIGDPDKRFAPAIDATQADLAGVWVLADGGAAVYIDDIGNVYRLEIASEIGGLALPAIVPRVFTNVGTTMLAPEGSVTGDLTVSRFGLNSDARVAGTLDETFNVIYDTNTTLTYDIGGGPQSIQNHSSWYRWDPVSATFPALEP
jgi:hypothetical protein